MKSLDADPVQQTKLWMPRLLAQDLDKFENNLPIERPIDLAVFLKIITKIKEQHLDDGIALIHDAYERSEFRGSLFLLLARAYLAKGEYQLMSTAIEGANQICDDHELLERTLRELSGYLKDFIDSDDGVQSVRLATSHRDTDRIDVSNDKGSCATLTTNDSAMSTYDPELLVPSNRSWCEVGHNLEHLASQALSHKFKVIISDNSCDPCKAEKLKELQGPHFRVLNMGNSEASDNWLHACKSSTSEFVQFVADDDARLQFNESVWAGKIIPQDVVGIAPICLLKSPDRGFYGIRQFNIDSAKALTRLSQYSEQCQGANTILYSSWRRDLWENVATVSTDYHPCSAGYQDWSISRAMLVEGRVLSDQSIIYVYSNENWFGPLTGINHEVRRLFRRSGMNEDLVQVFSILRSLDDIVFILRRNGYRESLENRFSIVQTIMSASLNANSGLTVSKLLEVMLAKITAVDSADGLKYEKFIENVIDERCLNWKV